MKKILLMFSVCAIMLTGCNNGSSNDKNATEHETTVSYSTETTSHTSATTETTLLTSVSTHEKKRDVDTTTTTAVKQTETPSSKTDDQTKHDTESEEDASKKENASEEKHSQNNGSSSEQEDIPERDRTNSEGDLIYEPEGASEEQEATDNTTEEFHIVTEAPIELPFIPAG
ncbi:hypothetical protein [Ruminococcus sp.]|uniref:hypothetical protein n=1 Tax=Ruminococcus sp. TaxID=41978 RepID=UPI0025F870E6|nr:hypothetical protein [Ruminococcus sp.]MCR4640211.1 hypothetical protein [Ruminococcus sp.]